MSLSIRPDDPRLAWPGAVSLEISDSYVAPWRIRHEERELFPPPDGLPLRAAMPAGVRIAFRSDTTSLAGEIEPQPEMTPLDLCCDGKPIGTVPMDGRRRFAFDGLPAGEKLVEIWLPTFQPFRLRRLELDDGASLAPHRDERPKWITYGSSITQCRAAASPTQTWPAMVARERNLDLTCLGFGGQCHLDPLIACMIRDLPADVITVCAGINVHGSASLSPRTFKPALIATVRIVRERHPDTPVGLISPICCPERESTPNPVGFTLRMMREEVADAVERLRAAGDRNVHYVDGLDLFGHDLAHLLSDGVHPTAEGYRRIGRNFLERVVPRFFP